jgi:hypothetical protein
MAKVTSCPECNRNLEVPPDLMGKLVRCFGCKSPFIAQPGVGLVMVIEEPQAPDQRSSIQQSEAYSGRPSEVAYKRDREADRRSRRDEEDAERRSRGHDDDERNRRARRRERDLDEDRVPRRRGMSIATRWERVQLGLTLVIFADWIIVACVVLAFFSAFIPPLFIVVSWAFGLAALAALALQLIGSGLCILVPGKRLGAARGLAIAAFACTVIVVGTFSVLQFMSMAASGIPIAGRAVFAMSGVAGMLALASPLIWLAGDICWMLFLRALAIEFRAHDLAGQIIAFMIAALVYFFLTLLYYFLVFGIVASAARSGRAMDMSGGMICFGLIGLLIYIGWFGGYIWYIIRLLTPVRDLVYVRLRRP